MNLVLDDADEVNVKKNTRKSLGKNHFGRLVFHLNNSNTLISYVHFFVRRKDSSER